MNLQSNSSSSIIALSIISRLRSNRRLFSTAKGAVVTIRNNTINLILVFSCAKVNRLSCLYNAMVTLNVLRESVVIFDL